jgi:hypothetical protein
MGTGGDRVGRCPVIGIHRLTKGREYCYFYQDIIKNYPERVKLYQEVNP